MVGPSTEIQFAGPANGNQAAAQADALANGQFQTPSMGIGRTVGNGADQFGGAKLGPRMSEVRGPASARIFRD